MSRARGKPSVGGISKTRISYTALYNKPQAECGLYERSQTAHFTVRAGRWGCHTIEFFVFSENVIFSNVRTIILNIC